MPSEIFYLFNRDQLEEFLKQGQDQAAEAGVGDPSPAPPPPGAGDGAASFGSLPELVAGQTDYPKVTMAREAGETDRVDLPEGTKTFALICGGPRAMGNVAINGGGGRLGKKYITDGGSLTVPVEGLEFVNIKYLDGFGQTQGDVRITF